GVWSHNPAVRTATSKPDYRVTRARPTRPTTESGCRLCRLLNALVRPRALGAAHLARVLAPHRPRRRRNAPSRLRPSIDAIRRARPARNVLHDEHGALAKERDRHRVEAHAVARDAGSGVGGAGLREPPIVQVC